MLLLYLNPLARLQKGIIRFHQAKKWAEKPQSYPETPETIASKAKCACVCLCGSVLGMFWQVFWVQKELM